MLLETGATYHVKGWNYKAVFELVSVNGSIATLQTPKTKKITHAPVDKLFYTKRSRLKLKPKEIMQPKLNRSKD
jgi:hypothetical protein